MTIASPRRTLGAEDRRSSGVPATRTCAPRREVASGTDVDEARAFYEDAYNGHDLSIEPVDADFSFRLATTGDADLRLRSNGVHGAMAGIAAVPDDYVVTWLTRGAAIIDPASDAIDLLPGRPIVLARDRPIRFRSHDHRQNLMHFDAGYLERIAAEEYDVSAAPLRFDCSRSPSPAALQRWSAVVAESTRLVVQPGTPTLLRAAAKRALAVALIETFPHAPADPARAGRSTVSSPRLRRAIDFIRANAHRPITPTDIADAAGLTVRGVQSAFQTRLQSSPLRYLREVRLDQARIDLSAGDRDTCTVAMIARRWGFDHLGRFAGYYADRFGEHPSSTLRRTARAS